MSEQVYIQKLLNKKLLEAKSKNKNYSLRAFSKKINMNPAALSEIIRGKRKVSSKMAKKIAERLNVSPDVLNKIQAKFNQNHLKKQISTVCNKRVILDIDYYHMVSDWTYYAILCLVETKEFIEDYKWIANRLNISEVKAKKTIKKLEETKFLKRNDDALLIPFDQSIKTSNDIKNISIRKRHEQNMEDAKEHLYNTPMDQREFGCITTAINSNKINEVKEMIRDFQKMISSYLDEDTEKNEVYELSIQFFPRTKIDKKK